MKLDEALEVLASLQREQVDYVLVGGAALTFHGLVRATEDLDIFVRPTAENIERLKQALRVVYNDPNIDEISAEDLMGDYPSVRYYPPNVDLFLDILTRLGEFATFDSLQAEEVESDGVRIKIASPRTLYWMKKDTVRDIDRMDAQNLRERFRLEDD